MLEKIPQILRSFFGGISDDIRKFSATEFAVTKHFDIFSQPNRLIPYRSLEADTNDGSTSTGMKQYKVTDVFYASQSAKMYGLGQNGSGQSKVVYKSDATVSGWTLPTSSEGNGAVQNGCFFEFKDYAWFFQGTNQLAKWGLLSGTPAITNTVSTVGATITSVANGIIAADGNGYIAYNNVIVRIAPGLTITDSAKTVPSNYKITSLANYGSYMAIAASPISPYNGQSKVFIWNLSSDLFQETIDWGEGDLRVLDNVEGLLVGITDRYLNNSAGAGKGAMVVKYYSGGSPQVFKEVFTQALTGKTIPLSKTVKNGRIFWAAKIMTNTTGTTYDEGIWSFGRKSPSYPFAVTIDTIDENIDIDGIQAFGNAANYFFIMHSGDGSIDKTDDVSNYLFTSICESLAWGNGFTKQKLKKIILTTAPLKSGGSVTVKIRVDSNTDWTTVGTYSTLNGLSRQFINIESTGGPFPISREAYFRLESDGGAEITGFLPIFIPLTSQN